MDNIGSLIIGVICFCIGAAFVNGFRSQAVEVYNEVAGIVNECESTLPRNQTCKYVITAVPEVAE